MRDFIVTFSWILAAVVWVGCFLVLKISLDNGSLFKWLGKFVPPGEHALGLVLGILAILSVVIIPTVISGAIIALTNLITAPPPPPPPPQCPKCGSEAFHTASRSESYEMTETRTRRTDHYDADDNYKGYSETEYEAPTTAYFTVHDHTCDSCGHKWTGN